MLPRQVQKDPETSLAWTLKVQLVCCGKLYYGKLPRKGDVHRASHGARLLRDMGRPSIGGATATECDARAVLKVLRKMGDGLVGSPKESGITDRATFTRAIDELQAAMIVVPSEAVYLPNFTYLWTLGIGRFPDALLKRGNRDTALREIARCFLGCRHDAPESSRA